VAEAGEAATGGAVLEREFYLAHPVAGPHRVDGHPHLHSVAAREGKHGAQNLGPHRSLAGDRCLRLEAAEAPDRPAGEAKREAEAAADPVGEGGHGKVAVAVANRLDERPEPARRIAQVTVAEQDDRRWLAVAQGRLGCSADVGALAVGLAAADHAGAGAHRQLGRAIA
jgi:hypothetical protein